LIFCSQLTLSLPAAAQLQDLLTFVWAGGLAVAAVDNEGLSAADVHLRRALQSSLVDR
jgi:hypothetical protein